MRGAGDGEGRVFLFLQGPHGPFFKQLARALSRHGAEVHRVAFNRADEAEWDRAWPLHRFCGTQAFFDVWIEQRIIEYGVTDLVLYGDTRPVHAIALAAARRHDVRTHCLEEGYLRPSWVTYERRGNNGNSPLMDISLPAMARCLEGSVEPARGGRAIWGDYRQHLWHSTLYHLRCLMVNRWYGRHRGHRALPLVREAAIYVRRALLTPWIRLRCLVQQSLLLNSAKTYHLVLLQLSFDASMQVHSGFASSAEFIAEVIDAFADGAGDDDYLVLKAHPFEDGRENLRRVIRDLAARRGVRHRVIFLDGGRKLASLLDAACSAVTVNSTAAQQALWRGLPVAALGRAVYRKPGLVSEQALVQFFRHPRAPDLGWYALFRHFLLQTSQFAGSFYSEAGRRLLLKTLPLRMLDPIDPYDETLGVEASGQRLSCQTQTLQIAAR